MAARTRQCGIEIGGVTVRVRGFGELEVVVMDRIWNRTINPGKVFDLELPLDDAAAGYRAMDTRQATKVLLRP